jgi:hypothetical protein
MKASVERGEEEKMTQTLLRKGVSLVFALMVTVLLMGLMNSGAARASTDVAVSTDGGTAVAAASDGSSTCWVYTSEYGWVYDCDLYFWLFSPLH